MELREYFRIIGRYKMVFWTTVVVLTLGAFIYTKVQPKTYLASTALTINKASSLKQSQVNYYLYDNYYNVQSSALFSEIVTSWYSSAAVVEEIYNKAGIPAPNISQKNLAKTFKAGRVEPATLNVSITGANKDDLTKLINASIEVVQVKTNELGRSDTENVYDMITFPPIVNETTPNIWLNTIIGLVAGLFLGAILTLAIEYFRKSS